MLNTNSSLFPLTKQCSKCSEFFPATTEFFFMDKKRQRLYSQCKTCWGKKAKAWRGDNREKSRAYTTKWKENNLEANREADALLHRQKRLTQGDHVRAVARAYTQHTAEAAGRIYHPQGTPFDPIVDGMKACTKCLESFPATTDHFQVQNRRPSGLNTLCKPCMNTKQRTWQEAHRDQCHEKTNAWYEKNKDRHAANGAKWRKTHTERAREIGVLAQHRRRAALYEAGPFALTIEDWHMIKTHFRYRCQYCHEKFPSTELTMDHITPVTKHGPTTIQNIIPACQSCNAKKWANPAPHYVQPLLL